MVRVLGLLIYSTLYLFLTTKFNRLDLKVMGSPEICDHAEAASEAVLN